MDQVLQQIQRALRLGKKLSDGQVIKLAELRRAANAGKHHVAVTKIDLREGEELWDFIDAVWSAVQMNRIVLADGSLDAWLVGIYNDFVVVQDMNTGRHFQSKFVRNADGSFEFSDPVEVKMVFVPVTSDEQDAGEAEKAVSKAATSAPKVEQIVDVAKAASSKWSGILPKTLRDRG